MTEKLVQACMNYALKLLAKRSYSEYELFKKLLSRYSEEIINPVIERCKSYKYLNDTLFVKSFIHDKQLFNKWGIKKITLELKRHKLTLNTDYYDFTLEEKNAEALIQKKVKLLKKAANDYEKRIKLKNYLIQKGYDHELVQRIVQKDRLLNK